MLKKRILATILVLFMAFQASISHAQLRRDRDYYIGKILKVNAKNQSIVLLDGATNTEKKFVVESGWENANIGQKVVVSAQKGTDIAKTLKPARK